MYIAVKPCNFGENHKYYLGDIIPDEVLSPMAIKRLIKAGIIAELKRKTEVVCIDIGNEEVLTVPQNEVSGIFNVLVGNASKAESIIAQMSDRDALKLLCLADSRKAVKAVAEARMAEISEEEGDN